MTKKQTSDPDNSHQASTYVVHPVLKSPKNKRHIDRGLEEQIQEISGLAQAIDLKVLGIKTVKVSKIQSGNFLSKGQRQDIADEIKQCNPDVIIFSHNLSPVQQRNLERQWNVKVIDRTGLIIEIFGERAQTKEGRLQVELAALEYQRSRLVRSWTHLERQRGGAGFMGGPGETQIEIDRRLIGQRITKLKKQLEDVRRTRNLGRKSREQVPFPVIALVGYTNAGKSTLFNHLTKAGVFAEDLPFATLDPTMRRIEMPSGQKVIISDTVGFISDLPTHLIAAFRATLEQINYADVIAHVIDVSREDYETQRQDVIDILSDLGIDYEEDERVIEVMNKMDAASLEGLEDLERKSEFISNMALVSALNGAGVDNFLDLATRVITRRRFQGSFTIDITDGKALSWLYEHAEILQREDQKKHIVLNVMIEPADLEKFTKYYGYHANIDHNEDKKAHGSY